MYLEWNPSAYVSNLAAWSRWFTIEQRHNWWVRVGEMCGICHYFDAVIDDYGNLVAVGEAG